MKTKEGYLQYLESEHWKFIRESVISRDGRKCTKCGSTHNLQAHHRFYRSEWTMTKESDCITLCRSCHEAHHGITDATRNGNFKSLHHLMVARGEGKLTRREFQYYKHKMGWDRKRVTMWKTWRHVP